MTRGLITGCSSPLGRSVPRLATLTPLPQGLCTSSPFCLASGSLPRVLFFCHPELILNVICSTGPSLITQYKHLLPYPSFRTIFSHFNDPLMLCNFPPSDAFIVCPHY